MEITTNADADTAADFGLRGAGSARGCADALVANRLLARAAQAQELVLVGDWLDLHGAPTDAEEVTARLAASVLPGVERFIRAGGHGTPEVTEFAAAELGVLLATSTPAAAGLMADVADLRHRHPLLWTQLLATAAGQPQGQGTVAAWQAREAAKRTRAAGLSLEQARGVDAATSPWLGSMPWSRWLGLLEAKIIAADPEAAEARRLAAATERFVSTGRTDGLGLITVIARATAGDALWFTATCDRIAECLRRDGDTDPIGARRSKALGLLARPEAAFTLLARHATDSPPDHPDEQLDGFDQHDAPDLEQRARPDQQVVGDPTAFLVAAGIDADRLRPPAVLYVHCSRESFEAALAGRREGVARMEGVGPITLDQVREFLAHAHVTLRPVLDLDLDHPVDGYEVPDRMREQLHLTSPATAFPWTPALTRRIDADHTHPYLSPDTGGPPGQTRIGNLGKLLRSHHRVKTHGPGWLHHQPRRGVHYWRTPTGHWCRVDATGTHHLGTTTPAEISWPATAHAGTPGHRSPHEQALARLIHAA